MTTERSDNTGKTILIAGGGVSGAAASIALQNAGFQTRVFEAQDEFIAWGVSIVITPNGMKAIRALGRGVHAGFLADGRQVSVDRKLSMYRPNGEFFVDRGLAGDHNRKFGEPSVVIRRQDLLGHLLEAQDEGTLQAGRKLTRFEDDGEKVTAFFEDGTTAVGDALIGADGINSTVRAQLWNDGPSRYAGFSNLRAMARGVEFPEGMEEGLIVTTDTDHVLLAAHGDGDVFVSFTFKVPEGSWPYDPMEAWQRTLEKTRDWWFIKDMVDKVDPATMVARETRDRTPPLKQWSKGRVSLLGDAAHAMTHFWGQGANSSLEDGVVLARALAQSKNIAEGLRLYDHARVHRAGTFQLASADKDYTSDHTAFNDWSYSYDAATAPLEPTGTQFAAAW